MQKVFIRHNPFTIETVFRINDQELPEESKLSKYSCERFQLWLNELIGELKEELNENSFKIDFHGTELDYQDLKLEVDNHNHCNSDKIDLEFIKCLSIKEKQSDLKKLFQELQNGPFEELRSESIKNAFSKAFNTEFEIGVIATMSSGKSTVINAILGQELMPSKNEACTATIARVKDIDGLDKFRARAFDKEGSIVSEWKENATLGDIDRFNSDKWVSMIEIEGNIPHISSGHMNLVLVDTPGPNNSRDESHKEHTFRFIKSDQKPMVLYVLNGTQLSTTDDAYLLGSVAESMRVGGKQSKDRFIFAVNKIDAFDPEKGESIQRTLDNVKNYLEGFGIENPNIYPLSAEMAKVIRMEKNGIVLTRKQRNQYNNFEQFTQQVSMNMLQYSPLSLTSRKKIDDLIQQTREEAEKALYYSGLPSIEFAINEYLEKYALPAKIVNVVNSFKGVLKEKQLDVKLRETMQKSESQRNKINQMMGQIKQQLEQGKKAELVKKRIEDLRIDPKKTDSIRQEVDRFITEVYSEITGPQMSPENAKVVIQEAMRKINFFSNAFKVDMDKLIKQEIVYQAQQLINNFKTYVADLIDIKDRTKPSLEFDVLTSNLPTAEALIEHHKEKNVVVGKRRVSDTKWYNPFSWGDYHFENVCEDRVDMDKLAGSFIDPVKSNYNQNIQSALSFLNQYINEIKDFYKEEFNRLHEELNIKLNRLENLSSDSAALEAEIRKSVENDRWLVQITQKLDKILEN